jgi:hypothetical protein
MSLWIKRAYIGDYLLIDCWYECDALQSTCNLISACPQAFLAGDRGGCRSSQKRGAGERLAAKFADAIAPQ